MIKLILITSYMHSFRLKLYCGSLFIVHKHHLSKWLYELLNSENELWSTYRSVWFLFLRSVKHSFMANKFSSMAQVRMWKFAVYLREKENFIYTQSFWLYQKHSNQVLCIHAKARIKKKRLVSTKPVGLAIYNSKQAKRSSRKSNHVHFLQNNAVKFTTLIPITKYIFH